MAEQIKKVTLRARDGEVFTIEQDIAKEFGILERIMEEDGFSEFFPVPNVRSAALEKVIQYCRKHLEFRTRAAQHGGGQTDIHNSGDAKAFDDGFVSDLSNNELRELIFAANYLEVKELLDLLSQTIADRIKNKSVEYAREFLGIENDYTTEELNALREKNAWAFEGVDDD
ncbi:hypothetical protein L6164_002108 [Bauhinia variegata]|uniref:Uncharacterized protein n=1 Tax=Bauhinia variegata TaxID=167791 RepID=A0ACB9PX10_BAUVA|nr:hypothetical protein L6164_002108 [Bauhinia variegata]